MAIREILAVISAYKWFKRWRKARKIRKALKALREADMDIVIQALKSKTVWLGIVSSSWGLVQTFLNSGDFSREAIVSLVTGVLIIVLRSVTTKPLAEK